MSAYSYPIKPCPKPRMTRSDKWKKRACVTRYWAFCDQVKAEGVTLEAGDSIVFIMPMPASWSEKKREKMRGEPHLQRPDLSNLLKAIEDAVHEEDSHLWYYMSLMQIWGDEGRIIITRNG